MTWGAMGWVVAAFAVIVAAFTTTYACQGEPALVSYDATVMPYAALPGSSHPPTVYASQPYYNVQQAGPYQPPGQYVPIGRTDAAQTGTAY
jgi:hypothetical protein